MDLIDSIQLNFAKVYIWHLESKLKCIVYRRGVTVAATHADTHECVLVTYPCCGELTMIFQNGEQKPRLTSSDKLVYIFLDDILYIKTRESFIVFVYKTGYTQVFLLLP